MPKIRELGISSIAFARPAENEQGVPRYWMCSTGMDGTDLGPEPEPCHPTPPQCHPTNKPNKPPKYAGQLPADAVVQLRQQLQQQISRQLHG